MEQTKLQALVDILLQSDCKELNVEADFEKIRIVRSYSGSSLKSVPQSISSVKIQEEKSVNVKTNDIKSTLVGVFHFNADYKIGDKVVVGEKIGYVESLKTKNDVVSDFSGNVYKIPVEEGETVEYGQVLIVLK